MPYNVSYAVAENGKVLDWYCRSFDTLDDTLMYYDDIDLMHEFSIEYMFSENGSFKNKTISKCAFDQDGTLIDHDYYDYARYKGGE